MTAQRHGTKSRYDGGCRCGPCSKANTKATTGLMHGSRRQYWRMGCRCDLCLEWIDQERRRDRERLAVSRAERGRPRPKRDPLAFERYAVSASRRVPEFVPRSVLCCERELLEVEGSGHDSWCRRAS